MTEEIQQQLHESFYAACPDAILILKEGVISTCNPAALNFFQIMEKELVGKKIIDFIPENIQQGIQNKLNDDLNLNHQISFESIIQNTKGDNIDVRIFLINIKTEKQIFTQVLIRDITAQKEAERNNEILVKKLEEEHRKLLAITDVLDKSAIISMADKEGKITKVNEEFCQISKYSQEELLGKDHNIVNSGYHSKEFWQSMWQDISRGKTWRAEVKNKTKDGSFYWVDTVINAVLDNESKITGYLSICYLITDKKEKELERNTRNEELATVEEELKQNLEELETQRDYIQGINEEIKTKSAIVEKNSQILLELNKNEDIHTGNLDKAFEIITKLIAQNLYIERVGIWRYEEQKEKIISQKQYQKNETGYEFIQVEDISKEEAPIYFEDVISERNIVADFAKNHPALVEFVDSYLIPLQINSMLDMPYFIDGKLAGVICCETQNKYKNWTAEDISFVKGMTDNITIAIKTKQQVEEQEKVRKNEKLLFQFLDKIPVGITIIGSDKMMFYSNQISRDIFPYGMNPKEGAVTGNYRLNIAGTDTPYPKEKFPSSSVFKGITSSRDDMEIVQDGKRTPIEISASPVYSETGEIIYAIAAVQDISERKAKELEIKKKNDELTTTEEELRQNLEELQATQESMREKQTTIEESKIALEKQNSKLEANEAVLKKAFTKMKEQDVKLRDSFDVLQAQEEELRQSLEEVQATQEILAYQKDILEISNRQITKSISYAQTIQNAFLPSKRLIKHLLPESFVIYKPKDIVSGDFYWLSEHKGKILIGAIDCTGHGVPGAFMSLVASSILNEIINQREIFHPNIILQELHKGVVKKLNQKEGANNDGMDLTLCLLEKTATNETKLTFAGVKQNLYIVRNQKLIELKGNRHSIGGGKRDEVRHYTQEEIILQKDDSVFLSTDGYADQANEERKSFSKKKFRELLLEIGHLSAQEQKKMLENSLIQHQQQTDQRDDITVFGFKV